MRCAPGQRCENARVYYYSTWERPSRYDLPDRPEGGDQRGDQRDGQGSDDRPAHRGGRIGARLANPLKPSITDLTPEQIAKAKMVRASRIAYEKGYAAEAHRGRFRF